MTAFIDTTAFYALIDADDANHERAVHGWRKLADEGATPVTHHLVAVESIALVQSRMGLRAVRDLLPFVEATDLVWIGPEDHEIVIASLLAGRRTLSYVDHASFHVMRQRGIDRALAFDRHFAREGFTLV